MSINALIKKYPYTLIVSLLILVFCLIPLPSKEEIVATFPFLQALDLQSNSGVPLLDKFVHGAFYLALGTVLLVELNANSFRSYCYCILYCFAWGGCIEIIQSLLPYRSGNGYDLLANVIGTFLSIAIYFLIYKSYERKNLSNGHHPPTQDELRQHQKTD